MNIAVFLDEVMPINGPLMLVPRSHTAGVLQAEHDTKTTSYPLWTLDEDTVTKLVDQGGKGVGEGKLPASGRNVGPSRKRPHS